MTRAPDDIDDMPHPKSHNLPDVSIEMLPELIASLSLEGSLAEQVGKYLRETYGEFFKIVDALLAEARTFPARIENEEQLEKATALVKNFRVENAKLASHHKKESDPYFRAKQMADEIFFVVSSKIGRRNPKDSAGASDIIQARVDDFIERKLEAEDRERQRASEEAARVLADAKKKADALAAEAEEARLKAERAKAPAQVEAKAVAAKESERAADAAAVEVAAAEEQVEAAYIATLAPDTDKGKVRTGGSLVSAQRKDYALVEDEKLLDKEKLWPHISPTEKQLALNRWAKATFFCEPMPGAKIGSRTKGRIT